MCNSTGVRTVLAILLFAAATWAGERACPDCARVLVRIRSAAAVEAHYVCRSCSLVLHVDARGAATASRRVAGVRRPLLCTPQGAVEFPAPDAPSPVVDAAPRDASPARAGRRSRTTARATRRARRGRGASRRNSPTMSITVPRHPVGRPGLILRKGTHPVDRPAHAVTRPGHPVGRSGHPVMRSGHAVTRSGHPISRGGHSVGRSGFSIRRAGHAVSRPSHPVSRPSHAFILRKR